MAARRCWNLVTDVVILDNENWFSSKENHIGTFSSINAGGLRATAEVKASLLEGALEGFIMVIRIISLSIRFSSGCRNRLFLARESCKESGEEIW